MGMVQRFTAAASFCLVLTCLFLTLGCSSPAAKFVGKWYDRQHGVVLEIRDDKTCVKSIPGYSGAAKWELVDDNNIKITYAVKGSSDSETATLKGDTLNFEGLVMKR